ncbi:11898_t:CDS:2, partial [Acaulospora morrowiae]
MSSYKVDTKTGLPVLYLKENKTSLWKKFLETYPNGMKRTSFMARLENSRFVYRDDLGELCAICNEYEFGTFEDMVELVKEKIGNKDIQHQLICQLKTTQRHLKREYEKELVIDILGHAIHNNCYEHCLKFVFGDCNEEHSDKYNHCEQVDCIFQKVLEMLPEKKKEIVKNHAKLHYYWAHQARKTYFNTQFNAALLRLDENSNSTSLNVEAFDHWSDDPIQDAWFTVSSFDALFSTMKKKPTWIEVLSDNGGHYHNKQLMLIISQWELWYGISIKSWIFLEPGETKTTIDSHHAQAKGEYAGHVYARALPGFDQWNTFSVSDVKKAIKNQEFTKPNPQTSDCTIPQSDWIVPLSNKISNPNYWSKEAIKNELEKRKIDYRDKENNFGEEILNEIKEIQLLDSTLTNVISANPKLSEPKKKKRRINQDISDDIEKETDHKLQAIYFNLEWALQEQQEFDKQDARKHMTEKVRNLLKTYFLSGNVDKKQKFTVTMMLVNLEKRAEAGELD